MVSLGVPFSAWPGAGICEKNMPTNAIILLPDFALDSGIRCESGHGYFYILLLAESRYLHEDFGSTLAGSAQIHLELKQGM